MEKVKGEYWKVDDRTVKLQVKTKTEQKEIEQALPGWRCVSYGYVPRTEEDIYVFEKIFNSERDCRKFLNSAKTSDKLEMREVKND